DARTCCRKVNDVVRGRGGEQIQRVGSARLARGRRASRIHTAGGGTAASAPALHRRKLPPPESAGPRVVEPCLRGLVSLESAPCAWLAAFAVALFWCPDWRRVPGLSARAHLGAVEPGTRSDRRRGGRRGDLQPGARAHRGLRGDLPGRLSL